MHIELITSGCEVMPNNYHVILHGSRHVLQFLHDNILLHASLVVCITIDDLRQFAFLLSSIKAVCMSLCFVRFTETISHDVFIPLEKIRNINTLYHLHLLCDLSFLLSCIACGYAACTLFFLYFPTISSVPIHIITFTYPIVYWFLLLLMDIICSDLTSVYMIVCALSHGSSVAPLIVWMMMRCMMS